MSNINNTKEQYELNRELAQMLKGGVIMDVTNAEQAKTAEAAGACAVMALERIPADIRAAGGVARMSDPKLIREIQGVDFELTTYPINHNPNRFGRFPVRPRDLRRHPRSAHRNQRYRRTNQPQRRAE